jgi:hypothetical protein
MHHSFCTIMLTHITIGDPLFPGWARCQFTVNLWQPDASLILHNHANAHQHWQFSLSRLGEMPVYGESLAARCITHSAQSCKRTSTLAILSFQGGQDARVWRHAGLFRPSADSGCCNGAWASSVHVSKVGGCCYASFLISKRLCL